MQLTRPAAAPAAARHPAWALALTSVAFFMTALDALVVVTALPAIHAGLGGSITTLEWTINAYTLPFAAGIITAAAVGDRLGRRWTYVTGLVLFTVASAACALAPDAGALIVARAIQGAGAAIVTPLSLTILAAAFPARRRGTIVGIWGAIGGLAVAGGPLIGGAIVQGLDWHWIFWINVPVGVLAAALLASRLPESRGPDMRLDLAGMTLVTAGTVLLAWALVRTTAAGWGSAQVIGALAAGLLLIAGFIWWEGRVSSPMLPLRLLRVRAFTAASVTGFMCMAAIASSAFMLSQLFQLGLGYSPLGAGLRFLPWTAMPLLVAPVAGRLCDRVGARPLMAAGMTLQAAGLGWIALDITSGASYSELVLPLMIAGVGISMVIPTTPTAALGAVPAADMGTASGIQNTLQRFGAVFGVAIVTAVFSASGHLGSAEAVLAGVRPGVAAAAGLSLAGAAAALAAGRRRAAALAHGTGADAGTPAITATPAIASAAPLASASGE